MRPGGGVLAGLLLAAGVLLLGIWALAFWIGPPLEEPANLGRTPNPSTTPWTHDPRREARERLWNRLLFYGPPGAGILLIAAGVVALAGRKC